VAQAGGGSSAGGTRQAHGRGRRFAAVVSPQPTRGANAGCRPGWLLAEQDAGATPRTKYYLIALPPTASLRALVQLAHQRWTIEQQYQELKDELGLDHFEGRSLPGWERHVALTALAYTFLQVERQRPASRALTLPHVRAIIREVLTAHFFVTRPHYLKRMLALQDVVLRI
jgi:hypothetical protein